MSTLTLDIRSDVQLVLDDLRCAPARHINTLHLIIFMCYNIKSLSFKRRSITLPVLHERAGTGSNLLWFKLLGLIVVVTFLFFEFFEARIWEYFSILIDLAITMSISYYVLNEDARNTGAMIADILSKTYDITISSRYASPKANVQFSAWNSFVVGGTIVLIAFITYLHMRLGIDVFVGLNGHEPLIAVKLAGSLFLSYAILKIFSMVAFEYQTEIIAGSFSILYLSTRGSQANALPTSEADGLG